MDAADQSGEFSVSAGFFGRAPADPPPAGEKRIEISAIECRDLIRVLDRFYGALQASGARYTEVSRNKAATLIRIRDFAETLPDTDANRSTHVDRRARWR